MFEILKRCSAENSKIAETELLRQRCTLRPTKIRMRLCSKNISTHICVDYDWIKTLKKWCHMSVITVYQICYSNFLIFNHFKSNLNQAHLLTKIPFPILVPLPLTLHCESTLTLLSKHSFSTGTSTDIKKNVILASVYFDIMKCSS